MRKVGSDFLEGGAGLNASHPYYGPGGAGLTYLGAILDSIHASYADAAAAIAAPTEDRSGVIQVGTQLFGWVETSLANDTTNQITLRPSDLGVSDPGRWELLSDAFALRLPVAFDTPDATVLFTVPAGFTLAVTRLYYEVSASFVNAAGRVGASSSNAQYATAGDLIGGATGDADTALTAGIRGGTIGAAFGSNGAVQLSPADTIRWDVLTPGFTAGAADLIVLCTRVR